MDQRLERQDEVRLRLPRGEGRGADVLVFANERVPIEDACVEQAAHCAALPGVFGDVVLSPDAHVGIGCSIGTVLASSEFVWPALVGVDINCGMRVLRTTVTRDALSREDVVRIVSAFRASVPAGEGKENVGVTRRELLDVLRRGLHAKAMDRFDAAADRPCVEDEGSMPVTDPEWALSDRMLGKGERQLGTLGGGNHFLELQYVDAVLVPEIAATFGLFEGQVILMFHCGSRGLGNMAGQEMIRAAKGFCDRKGWRRPHPDLSYFPVASDEGRRYLEAMNAAANFAFANRQAITSVLRRALSRLFPDERFPLLYDVPHNMAKRERHAGRDVWVHRKGATRAFGPDRMTTAPFDRTGQPVLIPGSMASPSFVLAGLPGNDASFCSVNHGAGRRMGRKQARRTISAEEHRRAMGDVVLAAASGDARDESPSAYKDIGEVIATVERAGLARAVAKLAPLGVLKG